MQLTDKTGERLALLTTEVSKRSLMSSDMEQGGGSGTYTGPALAPPGWARATWDEMWMILCDDPADYVKKYFPFMSACVR
jgi:hypothetical protein